MCAHTMHAASDDRGRSLVCMIMVMTNPTACHGVSSNVTQCHHDMAQSTFVSDLTVCRSMSLYVHIRTRELCYLHLMVRPCDMTGQCRPYDKGFCVYC